MVSPRKVLVIRSGAFHASNDMLRICILVPCTYGSCFASRLVRENYHNYKKGFQVSKWVAQVFKQTRATYVGGFDLTVFNPFTLILTWPYNYPLGVWALLQSRSSRFSAHVAFIPLNNQWSAVGCLGKKWSGGGWVFNQFIFDRVLSERE